MHLFCRLLLPALIVGRAFAIAVPDPMFKVVVSIGGVGHTWSTCAVLSDEKTAHNQRTNRLKQDDQASNHQVYAPSDHGAQKILPLSCETPGKKGKSFKLRIQLSIF
jgi:hypothetical protein